LSGLYSVKYIISTILSVLFIGCGSSTKSGFDKEYLYNLFETEYFWSKDINRTIDYKKYSEPQEMIDALKYHSMDRWSRVTTKKEHDNFLNQKAGGFGFLHREYEDEYRVVLYTRIDSPAYQSGLQRGDVIKMVNGKKTTDENMQKASSNLGETTIFNIYRPSSDESLEIKILSQEYSFRVTKYSIVTTPQDREAGYLRLDSFTGSASEEIDKAFDFFDEANITQLVVDLRYNTGGSVATASILLDKLIKNIDDEIQFTLKWNEEYQKKNQTSYFETDKNSLNLDQIIFLTTDHTASASELVINSLVPYMEEKIILIGAKTHGKPVGMRGKTDGDYIYYLVNFVISNQDGFYDYFEGLNVTDGCETEDDLLHKQGDIQEKMLKKALFYIDNGSC